MSLLSRFTLPRRFLPAALLAATALLTGCQSLRISNLTPSQLPANPSQIYTITASFQPQADNVDRNSISPRIIIDGAAYPMTRGSAADVWEFDYQLPPGRTHANYYFIVSFRNNRAASSRDLTSDLQSMTIAGRYVLRAEASRAPVGSRVSLLGAGFSPQDVVSFNQTPTRTVFESPSSLSFFVPNVLAGQSYQLRVSGGGTPLDAGLFRVDAINFSVSPSALLLRVGEQQAVTFSIPQPAPAGGMLIDITTDVPESVVMPEVIVPAGQTSVTVPVQGGKPGTGSIYFKSSAGENSLPITVTAR